MWLEIDNASIAYSGNAVVHDVSLVLQQGQIGCLLGPSGCGKTTLLRAIAGFERLTAGRIAIGGRHVSGEGCFVPPEQRRVGMVFQDLALFPHLTIADNIGFGLRGLDADERHKRIARLMAMIGLEGREACYPHQLSGGQQQRVAVARAMAPRPDLLLLDEPFSSMDADLREKLAREVRDILREDGVTALLVTHDQFEAFAMADEIGVMHHGRLAQWDNGYNLYHEPADRFVADFIGQGAMIRGSVVDAHSADTVLGRIHGDAPAGCQPGCIVDVLVRPDDIVHDDASSHQAVILEKAFRGAEYLYTLGLENHEQVLCMVQSHHDHNVGERIGIRVEIDHLVMFPAQREAT